MRRLRSCVSSLFCLFSVFSQFFWFLFFFVFLRVKSFVLFVHFRLVSDAKKNPSVLLSGDRIIAYDDNEKKKWERVRGKCWWWIVDTNKQSRRRQQYRDAKQ